jgi:hypothetical protein
MKKLQKHTLLFIAISLYILSILFKIMHWPYADKLQLLSLVAAIVWIYTFFKNRHND